MTLTLRIENFDTLEDGGPLWLTVDRRGASIGRKRGMDWVLPDPARHISGHHFDIGYNDGAYWLTDVSTNGTFVEGNRHRLEGPYRLQGGERLLVGHYVIGVQVALPVAAPEQQPGHLGATDWGLPASPTVEDMDPWDFGGGPVAPVNPVPPRPAQPARHEDIGLEFMPMQQPAPPPRPAPQGLQVPGVPQQSQPVTSPPQFGGGGHVAPPALQMPSTAVPAAAPVAPPAQPAPQPVIPEYPTYQQAPPDPRPAPGAQAEDFVHAFCQGAGVNPTLAQGVDGLALAQALGRVARLSADEIMRMLQDRANVKQFTKGGERTMRSATGNNPMKFLPDAEQALEAMFLRPRDGFMTGPDGFDNALKDLRAHQMAVFAALQPALAAVLDGLSPEEIEATEVTGNLLGGSRKGKSWDLFVRRWDAKANAGDHGMLDAFLLAFARAYAEVNARGD